MHILHVTSAYWPFVGGAETYIQAVSERLVQHGHTVSVLTTDAASVDRYWDPRQPPAQPAEEMINGVLVRRCRIAHLPLSPWSFYALRRTAIFLARTPLGKPRLMTYLARHMPWVPEMESVLENRSPIFSLVHGVNISLEWPLIAGLRYARRHGLPFVATPFLHAGVGHVQRNYTMPHQVEALRQSDAVLVQTGIEAHLVADFGVSPQRIVRLGMGIDPTNMQGGQADRFRAEHGIEGAIVTLMGAVTYDKGAVHLTEAMRKLWDGNRRVSLVLAGPTPHPGGYESFFKNLPAADKARILRLGVVTGQAKQDLLAATDILALPSRVDSFGIVYLEAWAYGKPVIGAQAGGVPDVIADGEDGMLVPFGDVECLAESIEYLLRHPQKAAEMGAKGRQKVLAHYTWSQITSRLLGIYEALLAGKPLPGAWGAG